MCLTFTTDPQLPGEVSCNDTQFFLVQDADGSHVRLLGLLPVKTMPGSAAPSLLFFPMPHKFAPRVAGVGQIKCQAQRIKGLIRSIPPPVATRGLSFARAPPSGRVVKNQDGSVVCVLHSSQMALEAAVDGLQELLQAHGVDPERVFKNGTEDKEAFMQQVGPHFVHDHDMVVCVPPTDSATNKPVVDGRGFSIQFVWAQNEFDGDIPVLGLVHNHQHQHQSQSQSQSQSQPEKPENLYVVSALPRAHAGQLAFGNGSRVSLQPAMNTPRCQSSASEICRDLSEAASAVLGFDARSVGVANLATAFAGGSTRCSVV